MSDLKKINKLIVLLFSSLLTIALIAYSSDVKDAISNVIVLCGINIIPSLFPIFCLTLLITNIGAITLIPKKALPHFLFLLSLISGYPVGAKLLDTLVQNGQITNDSAKKVLPSMICAGPAFIINIVGAQIFSDQYVGIRIYICQIAANYLLFILLGGPTMDISRYSNNIKAVSAVTRSVEQSTDSIINICSYVILFSAFSSIFSKLIGEDFSKYFLYVFEVTGAVFNSNNIYLTCMILSWGGICVIFQILSVIKNLQIKILPLFLLRIISGIISCTLLKLSFKIFPHTSTVISNLQTAPQPAIAENIPFVAILFISLMVLLFSISSQTSGKFLKDITNQ